VIIEKLKQDVAQAALDFIVPGTVLGLGSGTTVSHFIKLLTQVKHKIEAVVAGSLATAQQLKASNIPLVDLNTVADLDVYIDSADEVDPYKNLIKGGGGALTREKIIAAVAKNFICMVDASKVVSCLGNHPVAVEVIPMARSYVAREIIKMHGTPVYRNGYITDNGNVIVDVFNLAFSDLTTTPDLETPRRLETQLKSITGVVDNGIFAQRKADLILLSNNDGIQRY
jgi:ribose 5-phosphate isomerase A